MLLAILLAQAAPAPTIPAPAKPCRMQGPRGKLIDVDPALCLQSTWDKARLPEVEGEGPATTMELDVDATGKVTTCRVVGSSGNAALDGRACSVAVDKAHYRPAVDADGRPVTSHMRMKVRWPALK